MSGGPAKPEERAAGAGSLAEVFLAFLALGCTSFGGPVAHLGYFRQELVIRRGWLEDQTFGELVGLCQFLPGPASSQVCFGIGSMRAGPLGGPAAWVAFTLPSAALMFGFATIAGGLHGSIAAAAIHGLKVAAVAIVAQALLGMARTLTPDLRRRLLALIAAVLMLALGVPALQLVLIAAGAGAGMLLRLTGNAVPKGDGGWMLSKRAGSVCLAVFGALFVGLPLLGQVSPVASLANVFYRAGALVFGGGHVVLPLLRDGLVPHWMSDDTFLAGYGAAQLLPGPLFTIGTYLGAEAMPGMRVLAALIGTFAISAPGLLLLSGVLPYRRHFTARPGLRSAIAGVNAVVVGILAAALYNPLWTTAIIHPVDAVIAVAGYAALVALRASPLLVVVATTIVEVAISALW